jgi:hypothetical protein
MAGRSGLHCGVTSDLRNLITGSKITSGGSTKKPPGCGRAANRSSERLPNSICAQHAGIRGQATRGLLLARVRRPERERRRRKR